MSQESLKKTMERAGNILSYHALSAAQLYDRLVEKGESEEDAAAVVAKLLQLGYLNDLEYARMLLRQGIGKGYGPARLRQELRKRGVPKLRCVYSTEPAIAPRALPGAETKGAGRPAPGSVSFVPSVAGLYLAYEAIRMMTEG